VDDPKFKPFDVLAEQFNMIATVYKHTESEEERRRLLALMRLIIDEADSLHRFHSTECEPPTK
jgi:hypothetical protein